MRVLNILKYAALLAIVGCTQAAPVPSVTQKFVRDVSEGLVAFEVKEHKTTRDERSAFVTKSFNLPRSSWGVEDWKELHVSATSGRPTFHLGVVLLRFESEDEAGRVYAKLPPADGAFLAGTKILTRFVALRRDNDILFVYSESHLQPAVGKFLDELSRQGESLWK